jgi:hypothetical protein
MTTRRKVLYLTLASLLLLVVYRGVLIYNAVKAPITTSAQPPVTLKETNTLTWTREVVVGEGK